MKQGDTVKYSKPQGETEAQFRFTVVHADNDRADIELICDSFIRPVETVAIEEICPA